MNLQSLVYFVQQYSLVDKGYKVNKQALRAVRDFAADRPWKGGNAARKIKLLMLHRSLCRIYGVKAQLTLGLTGKKMAGSANYNGICIHHRGNLSVLSYLAAFAQANGHKPKYAAKWAINVFRKAFPKSYANLGFVRRAA